ncbi:hypothetical protein GCK72_020821 [Caenorhabditis remanei]|uniref:BTB domain-containing protein n=1 Tax=Caenorhabditis remanei TaxID=31234 RepID=A0A6A5GI36_CAERE|nr:hypothetical protein GCK72_020821 [Caenorhabditis remanei]KAF1754261.1 hypothetical protein GCK72_020821 [Caenorhabditis remanei]
MHRSCGRKISLDTLLDERNGWLSNGTLSIEYGFRVEAIQDMDGIWGFNFHEMATLEKQDTITLYVYDRDESFQLYPSKQVVYFHSSYLKNRTFACCDLGVSEHTDVLQIAHGVNVRVRNLRLIIPIAKDLEFQNVIRFCERQLIQENLCYRMNYCNKFQIASKYNLNHYLAHLLKNVRNVKRLAVALKTVKLKKMSSEYMKQCTKYFFENA